MTISEVSKKYELSADTLRYYERIGLIPPVSRNKSGIRSFTEKDCEWVNFIKCMRSAGLSIETLIEYVTMFQKGNETIKARKDLLIEQRNQLSRRIEDMQKTLERLNSKIDGYEDKVIEKEKTLKNNSESQRTEVLSYE
ncbi:MULTISPECIES: MerR family transcriptional regulator [unclassified Clostridioides]|uniref:MerR family transcriptional regulator n=1 Tax=unclassified Clostridioides TaxID=2635829 RepID=UPI001D1241C5|nr:MerR family transcriptional regulator [Clostridioides sp. ZZV15-6388]MCC0645525.1 MerR family transcriptional regulator [Clostridioides sp. ZZV14-6150]MCC0660497.1 MerR family transcriptional regulator [Clostridioides sp. ZZV14-6154]MCC0666290.1 MerR family transcriptional regulator [Clostridioides sp. ZZV15-6597]MCC0669622.1 MerR family transcriptional regulator [Clostridioides sp. ZZV14-6153]MCC0718799.1 MerR family transcriptional regulator [Clostridioides sp. ZZV14-6105]MCC0723343.1 Me